MTKEVLTLALEALEESIDQVEGNYISDWRHGLLSRAAQLDGMRQGVEQHKAAIAAIKEALAAPLSDKQISDLAACHLRYQLEVPVCSGVFEFARAIERHVRGMK